MHPTEFLGVRMRMQLMRHSFEHQKIKKAREDHKKFQNIFENIIDEDN